MHNHDLDAILRLKLADAELKQPIPPEDWARMDAELDNLATQSQGFDALLASLAIAEETTLAEETLAEEMATDWEMLTTSLPNAFDSAINSKLHYAEAIESADWDAMQALLPNPFDTLLQAKLAEASLPTAEGEWDSFAAKLDETFDQTVREKIAIASTGNSSSNWRYLAGLLAEQRIANLLATATVPYNPADWRIMARLLATEGITVMPWYSRPRIYAAAAAVATFVLFGGKILLNSHSPITAIAPPIATLDVPAHTDTYAPNSFSNTRSASAQTATHHAANARIAQTTTVSHASAEDDATEETINLKQYESSRPLPDMLRFNAVVAQVNDPLHTSPVDIAAAGREDILMGVDKHSRKQTIDVQPLTAFGENIQLQSRQSEHPAAELMRLPESHIKPDVSVGLYTALLQSATEFSAEKALGGNATGLRLQVQLSKHWSIVSGLLNANKHFSHEIISYNEQAKRYENQQLTGDLQLMEIPVLARYDLPIGSRVVLFMQGGVAANVSLHENYQLITTQPNDANGAPTKTETRYKMYAGTLQFSPGVSCKISERISLQTESYLQIGVQPLGNTDQKLNSTGIAAVLLYRLK